MSHVMHMILCTFCILSELVAQLGKAIKYMYQVPPKERTALGSVLRNVDYLSLVRNMAINTITLPANVCFIHVHVYMYMHRVELPI